jgi:hypothetical protein
MAFWWKGSNREYVCIALAYRVYHAVSIFLTDVDGLLTHFPLLYFIRIRKQIKILNENVHHMALSLAVYTRRASDHVL